MWNSKEPYPHPISDGTLNTVHELALVLNGYDSAGSGPVTTKDFVDFASTWVKRVGFQKGDSVFEVGCGAGNFLQAIHNVADSIQLAGSDLSLNLIETGRDFFPHLDLRVAKGATSLDGTEEFNHLVSFGVFHYFDSLDYAKLVIEGMKTAALNSVSILDVPDLSTKDSDIQHRRSQYLDGEYELKYKDLPHLYYSRNWMTDLFPTSDWSVCIENQSISNYSNADFRFNVFAVRTDPFFNS